MITKKHNLREVAIPYPYAFHLQLDYIEKITYTKETLSPKSKCFNGRRGIKGHWLGAHSLSRTALVQNSS